ncbi:hypothetical protein SAMN02745784_02270 [Tissierella praeacuta DSM 18095]|uniref:LysR substrate binding domain-containing protein n=1 Tax=Tissierella praeacuta DSM 18095 TaxID=1123404 RepID=A0A1M4XIE4_9FIRM|nr:hypothetical protein [Tissierella praeacuta]SHE93168.1 hypothetical protein SAMN02745784_02270 [Tissierella praeacuta DSM 18095]SUP02097.1 Uncharacterised protein [Tissierella praeacuta]
MLREKGSAIRDVFDSALPKILIEEINSGEIFEIKVNDFQLVNINHIVFHKDKFQTKSFKTLIKIIKNKADDK